MSLHQDTLALETRGRGTYELTREVQRIVAAAGCRTGVCHVFVRHTSASLMICENADPAVLADLETFMSRLVPDGDPAHTHRTEGADDMPAHIRSVLTQSALTLPVTGARCALGTWQGIFLWEHRRAPHRREVTVTVQGSPDEPED